MADGSVVLVEIQRQTLSRVRPDGAIEVVAELGGGPNGAAVGPDGAVYVTNNGGFQWAEAGGLTTPHGIPDDYKTGSIQRVDLKTGAVSTVYDSCDGIALRGPNDIVFDAAGGFWFTDIGKTFVRQRDHSSLFYARADGSHLHRAVHPAISFNGVGLSPDESVVYCNETETQKLWAFDVAEPGKLRPFSFGQRGRVVCTLPGHQWLDSLAVEANGNVCSATLLNGGITIFAPDGSFEHVAFPDPLTTNICFGGDDMRDAYITLSGTGKLVKARWPRPGLKLNFQR
jgi:gluconolactonase